MGSEYIALSVLGALIVFVFSFSVVLNLVFLISLGGSFVFLRNVLNENSILQSEMAELDSQLIMSDSINDIIEHILVLREELFEIHEMDVFSNDPTIQRLTERIGMTLEKIESSVINQEYLRSIEQKNDN